MSVWSQWSNPAHTAVVLPIPLWVQLLLLGIAVTVVVVVVVMGAKVNDREVRVDGLCCP